MVSRKTHNVLVVNGLRIHTCPKNASAAISHALHRTRFSCATPDEPGTELRFMAVRHPLDRIVSTWAFFCQAETDQEIVGQQDFAKLGYYWRMSFKDFLAVFEQTFDRNPHTQMQVEFAGPHPIQVLCPLHKLIETWGFLRKRFTFLNPLTVSHQSRHRLWPHYYTDKEREHFESLLEEDVALYRRAQKPLTPF